MVAGSLLYIVTLMGHAATATRSFGDQAKLVACVLITTIAANFAFVPRFRLWGAVAAVGTGNLVYVIGMVIIVRRVVRGAELLRLSPAVPYEAIR
jgi:O-antigen/teichoic acid export membrane protein